MSTKRKKTFSVDDGLALQQLSLQRWKRMLNKPTYEKLAGEVEKQNRTLTADCDGHDVCRGDGITNILLNLRVDITEPRFRPAADGQES